MAGRLRLDYGRAPFRRDGTRREDIVNVWWVTYNQKKKILVPTL